MIEECEKWMKMFVEHKTRQKHDLKRPQSSVLSPQDPGSDPQRYGAS